MASRQASNNEIAEAFTKDEKHLTDLVFHEEYNNFFFFKDGFYNLMSRKKFKLMVHNYIRTNFPTQSITINMVKDIISQIELLCYRTEQSEVDHIISLNDVFYNTKTFSFEPKKKELFTIFNLPFNSEELKTSIPNFLRFLDTSIVKQTVDGEYFEPDKDLQLLVQEMMGFFMLGGLNGYRAFFLIGEGANGKGVLSRVLMNIFGKDQVQSMTIQALTTNEYNSPELIGKKINISSEDESKYIDSSKFKAIVAGDYIHAEVKFGEGFSFIPKTKFLFCANRMPTFPDVDYAIKRRLIFIPFLRKFLEGDIDKDPDLDEKLKEETPGIITWALEGAKRLVNNNYNYTSCTASFRMMKDFEEDIMSAVLFIRELYVIDDNLITGKKDLYSHYRIFCEEIGKKSFSYSNFKKQILSNFPTLKERATTSEGKFIGGYNLATKTEYDKYIEQLKQSFNRAEKPIQDIRPEPLQGNLQV